MAHGSQLIDFVGRLRVNTLEVLRAFASLRAQPSHQAVVPHGLIELFCQWGDVYQPGGPVFEQAFGPSERAALAEFNEAFDRASTLTDTMPEVEAYIVSDACKKLAGAAAEALRSLADGR